MNSEWDERFWEMYAAVLELRECARVGQWETARRIARELENMALVIRHEISVKQDGEQAESKIAG